MAEVARIVEGLRSLASQSLERSLNVEVNVS
jgi:hypothetical protein